VWDSIALRRGLRKISHHEADEIGGRTMPISARQAQLLRIIIEEYVKTAEAVGSENIVAKHNLGVSPATVRNEMAALTQEGYLEQPHTSAGRTPTGLGFRYYLQELMQEQEIPVISEVAIKQRLWQERHELENLLRNAVLALAEETKEMALVTTDTGKVYTAGAAFILDNPEFYDIELTRAVLALIDQHDTLLTLFGRVEDGRDVHVLIGAETGLAYLAPCGVVFRHFDLGRGRFGTVAVLGPARMNYPAVMPTVRYFSDLMNELSRSW
jgi:transcriptional regulator of heat shock response